MTEKPAHSNTPNVMSVTASAQAPDMVRIVERCREAIERMSWTVDGKAPNGVEAWAGATDDGWTATVMPFNTPKREAAAGAVTYFKEGLVVHLPEALAQDALKRARASGTKKT